MLQASPTARPTDIQQSFRAEGPAKTPDHALRADALAALAPFGRRARLGPSEPWLRQASSGTISMLTAVAGVAKAVALADDEL